MIEGIQRRSGPFPTDDWQKVPCASAVFADGDSAYQIAVPLV